MSETESAQVKVVDAEPGYLIVEVVEGAHIGTRICFPVPMRGTLMSLQTAKALGVAEDVLPRPAREVEQEKGCNHGFGIGPACPTCVEARIEARQRGQTEIAS